MVGLLGVLSATEQKHIKRIIIAHGLLRTHTQPSAQRTPTELPPPTTGTWGGAALCQGARLTLSLLCATGNLALLQIFAGRLNQRGYHHSARVESSEFFGALAARRGGVR